MHNKATHLYVNRFLLNTNGIPRIVVNTSIPIVVPTPNIKIYKPPCQTLSTVLIVSITNAALPASPWTKSNK